MQWKHPVNPLSTEIITKMIYFSVWWDGYSFLDNTWNLSVWMLKYQQWVCIKIFCQEEAEYYWILSACLRINAFLLQRDCKMTSLASLTWSYLHRLSAECWSATPDHIWQQHEEECFQTYQHSQSPPLCTEGEENQIEWIEHVLLYLKSEYNGRAPLYYSESIMCYKTIMWSYHFGLESGSLWSART